MLTHIDTQPLHNATPAHLTNGLFEQEKVGIIKAIEDIFHISASRPQCSPTRGRSIKGFSISRLPVSMLQQAYRMMDYELMDVVPIKNGMAIIEVQQTPLDRHGKKILEGISSQLLVIAKADDEWEMVGLPLPLHCVL